ncbi:MAG: hypothetical protein AAF483_25660 [Planctomycetota bacterium]
MAKQRRVSFASYLPMLLMGVTAIGMLGLAGFFIAWVAGVFDRPESRPVDRTGQLACPALVRPVSAFEKLTKDDFINPQTNQLHVMWLPEKTAARAIRDMGDLIGRVVKRDRAYNVVLSEADLLEKGTRPGLAAGIPPNKFAVTIPTASITGLDQLLHGDRFDLLVALPERNATEQVSNSEPAALFGGIKPPSLRVGQLSRQHGVKRLVTNGMLVTLFTKTKRSTTGASGLTITPSRGSKAKTVTSVVAEVAVSAEEIGPLTEAISLSTKLTCVIRSGQPTDEKDDVFNPEGLVPVITTSKAVSAFSALTDENLIDEATGQLHLYYFPEEKVADTWITDPTQLYGRVVSRQLRRGALITEEDLLPVGTRPGISAGLPAGSAAMSVTKTQVKGFEKLVIGDRFSILTRVPENVGSSLPSVSWATLQGGQLSEDAARLEQMVRTGIREVAKDATFLSEPDDASVVIGISQQDVSKLAQLLRDQSELFVVANSSRKAAEGTNANSSAGKEDSSTSAPNPFSSSSTNPHHQQSSRFVSSTAIDPQDDNETVPVPVLVRDATAFRPLSIDDFVDPATGQIRILYFPKDKVLDAWELDVRELIDRVPLRGLRSGRVVLKTDLAPTGTLAGPAIGIPAGMRGVTVNSAQVQGLDALAEGSVFDLATSGSVAMRSLADKVSQSLASSNAIREAAKKPNGNVSTSRVLAPSVILLADLGEASISVQRAMNTGEVQRTTRLAPDGSTITEEIVAPSAVSTTQMQVQKYMLAVPEASVTAVIGMLDVQNPLRASILPLSNASESSASRPTTQSQPVRAVIQEHVRGEQVTTEVFLTDQPESPAAGAKDESVRAGSE